MTHSVAKLDPVTDPLVLRDKTMESYAHNVRRQGVEPDMEYIRALAEADLGMVENYDRSIAGKVQPKAEAAPTPTERKRDDDPVSTYAKENNLRIHVRDAPDGVTCDSALKMPYSAAADRWTHAQGRIMQILEPQGVIDSSMEMKDVPTRLEAMWKNAKVPQLARMVLEIFSWANMSGKKHRLNPFYGLGPRDMQRKYVRMIEDVCDASTGIPTLGPWYIK